MSADDRKFEAPTVTPIGNLRDRLAHVCATDHRDHGPMAIHRLPRDLRQARLSDLLYAAASSLNDDTGDRWTASKADHHAEHMREIEIAHELRWRADAVRRLADGVTASDSIESRRGVLQRLGEIVS